MPKISSYQQKIVLATFLGAILGGSVVALATKAIPKMMSQVMDKVMKNMMAHMREGGGPSSEI